MQRAREASDGLGCNIRTANARHGCRSMVQRQRVLSAGEDLVNFFINAGPFGLFELL